MSLRTLRRSQAAAASGAVDEGPSVPISEIRVRKWSKQIKTVGHITVVKWVPEQEHPTEALQRGGFKKTKGRKRPVAEMSRMTRSVRQHLDAPLELLVEMPAVRQSTRATAGLGIVPSGQAAPAPTATAAPPVVIVPKEEPSVSNAPATSAPVAPPTAMPGTTSSGSLLGMSSDPMVFSDGVASEEQLERALDDLPFLDSDNLAMENLDMDPVLALGRAESPARQQPPSAPTTQAGNMTVPTASIEQEPVPERVPVAQPSPEASVSAASAEEDGASSSSDSSDDDDDDDDGNETASVDSAATPQQSPSPVMSRSPSP